MGEKPAQQYAWCSCGEWTYNWRIEELGGKCLFCKKQLEPFKPKKKHPKSDGGGTPPWREPSAISLRDFLPEELRATPAAQALQAEIGKAEQEKQQKATKDPSAAKQAMLRADRIAEQEEQRLLKSRRPEPKDSAAVFFEVDSALFENIDEYGDSVQESLRQWQAEVARHQQELQEGQERFEELLKSIKAAVEEPANKKRRTPEGAVHGAAPAARVDTPAKQAPPAAPAPPIVPPPVKAPPAKVPACPPAKGGGTAAPAAPSAAERTANLLTEEQATAAREAISQKAKEAAAAAKQTGKPATLTAAKEGLRQVTLFFGNVTQWGPKASRYIHKIRNHYKVVALAGTHVEKARIPLERETLRKDGWKLAATPAVKKHEGYSAGEWILARNFVATTTMDKLRMDMMAMGHKDPFRGFVTIIWHLQSGSLVVVSTYLSPGMGVQRRNADTLKALSAFLFKIRDPWIVLGDWNMSPAAFTNTKWPSKMQGHIVTAGNVDFTCDQGTNGGMHDYALVKDGYQDFVNIQAVLTVPWRPHSGLEITMAGSSSKWWHRSMELVPALPAYFKPKLQAQADSKRSKQKRKQTQRRAEALPEQLQDAFNEMIHEQDGQEPTQPQFHIPEDNWTVGLAQADALLTDGLDFAPHPIPVTQALARDEEGQHQIDWHYARWATALEETILSVEPAPQRHCTGRRNGFQLQWEVSKSTPGRVHVEDKPAELWGVMSTLVSRLRKLVAKGLDPVQQEDIIRRLKEIGAGILKGTPLQYFGKNSDTDREEWAEMYCRLCNVDQSQIQAEYFAVMAMKKASDAPPPDRSDLDPGILKLISRTPPFQCWPAVKIVKVGVVLASLWAHLGRPLMMMKTCLASVRERCVKANAVGSEPDLRHKYIDGSSGMTRRCALDEANAVGSEPDLRHKDIDDSSGMVCRTNMDDEDDVFAQPEHEEEIGPPPDLEPAEVPFEVGPAQLAQATLSLDFLDKVNDRTESLERRAQARAFAKGQHSFMKWIRETWAKKPGILHRHVKGPQADTTEVEGMADPALIMNSRHKYWQKVWTDKVDTMEDIVYEIGQTLRVAKKQPTNVWQQLVGVMVESFAFVVSDPKFAESAVHSGAREFYHRRELDKYERKQDMENWGLTLTVVSGGQWTRERQRAQGYATEPLCRRCGREPETLLHRARWTRAFRSLEGITKESLNKIALAASKAAKQAQRAVARQRLHGFQDWVCQHAVNGMGVLRRHVKDPMAQVSEIRYAEGTTFDGASLMEAKRATWDTLWTPTDFCGSAVVAVLHQARELARHEELQLLTLVLCCALRLALAAGPAESAGRQARGGDQVTHTAAQAMPVLERQVSALEARVRHLRRQRRQRPPPRPLGEGAVVGSDARGGGEWLQEGDTQAALAAAEADAGDPAVLAVAEALSEENKLLRRENMLYRRQESERMSLLETETEWNPNYSKLDGISFLLLCAAMAAPCCYCACLVIKHEGVYSLGNVCCWCCDSMCNRSASFWWLLAQYLFIAALAGRVLFRMGAADNLRSYVGYGFIAYIVVGPLSSLSRELASWLLRGVSFTFACTRCTSHFEGPFMIRRRWSRTPLPLGGNGTTQGTSLRRS
ncbi:unnamed protein product [Prorocentrum cordatum]|uniref:Uncharacterized protein n=1 Tax=Prorocentrum cordatum TaxID=2364126 RepID=A0ABN9SYK1_9DINO|nr:unnamed protein product [Polarella glacialis]